MPASTAAVSVIDRSCNASPADFIVPSDSDSEDNTEGMSTDNLAMVPDFSVVVL